MTARDGSWLKSVARKSRSHKRGVIERPKPNRIVMGRESSRPGIRLESSAPVQIRGWACRQRAHRIRSSRTSSPRSCTTRSCASRTGGCPSASAPADRCPRPRCLAHGRRGGRAVTVSAGRLRRGGERARPQRPHRDHCGDRAGGCPPVMLARQPRWLACMPTRNAPSLRGRRAAEKMFSPGNQASVPGRPRSRCARLRPCPRNTDGGRGWRPRSSADRSARPLHSAAPSQGAAIVDRRPRGCTFSSGHGACLPVVGSGSRRQRNGARDLALYEPFITAIADERCLSRSRRDWPRPARHRPARSGHRSRIRAGPGSAPAPELRGSARSRHLSPPRSCR